jgi:hypothetical protein
VGSVAFINQYYPEKIITMLTTLNQVLLHADDRFLNDQELRGLENYVQTYSLRQQAYQMLSDQANDLVMQALKQLAQSHRQDVETHGAKCKRDMAYALKYVARAMLMDESEAFRQDFALWMENITRAVHKGNSAAVAYGYLKQEIQKALPAQCAILVTPYLDDLITAFSGQ